MAVAAGSHDARTARHGASPRPGRVVPWWPLAAIVALGVTVRFTTLTQQSFWYDEGVTWAIVSHGLGHVLSAVPRTESTPPLYYVLLWLWSRVFGTGEAGLRSFSAVCGTLAIPVVWLIGRRLVSERVGLVAALLTAVNPFLFWYSQEARAYSLLLLLSALSLLALVGALQAPGRARLLGWGVVGALALAVHYYAAVLIAAEAVTLGLVLRRRGRLTPTGAAVALAPLLAVGAALTPLLIRQNDGRAAYIASQEGSLPHRIVQLVKEDIIGQGQPDKALLTAIGCALVAVALGLLVTRARRSERSAALLAAAVGLGGIAVAVVVAVVATDYFNTRNLIATWPALMLVVAVGLGGARAGRAGAAATVALTVLSLVCVANVVADPVFQRPDWRGAAQALGPRGTEPRALVSDQHSQAPLQPYLPGLAAYPAAGDRVGEVDVVWLPTTYGAPLAPITPVPLPGFRLVAVRRTQTYAVLRYRAAAPRPESAAALAHLYPDPVTAAVLVQRP